jgi:N-methylhydantoinase B
MTVPVISSAPDWRRDGYLPAEGPFSPMPLDCWVGDAEVDPITFEVVRHRIFLVTEEQGLTIVKVSGSPVASFAHDFATTILTADAEVVYFGPYNQAQVGTIDHNVKWILEHRADNPGIHDGDMFLANDPWIGGRHQPDVRLMCPIFWEGKLLCWVGSVIHTYDVGGNTPGSFCPDAEDIFDESLPTPPIALVERGVIRKDIEDMFVRRSRLPELVTLDLRALVASSTVARQRVHELATRYGGNVVATSMNRVVAAAERRVAERLATIPDGSWSHRGVIEISLPGDRGTYELQMTLRKEGTLLTFDHNGTHEQLGSLNTTVGNWRSSIVAVANRLLGFDLMHATGGIVRHLRFDSHPGTIVSAEFPSSVSNGQFGGAATMDMATICLSRMLATSHDSELASRAMAGCTSSFPVSVLSGIGRNGEGYGILNLDAMGGAIGAFAGRDGADTGGQIWDPGSLMPNVEYAEQYFPVLYLYRRELIDSGGAGHFRGGNSAVLALTPHKVERIDLSLGASGWALPSALGLFGGYPGCASGARIARGALSGAHNGSLPQSMAELQSPVEDLQPKIRRTAIERGDVYELWWSGAGGFGDPFLRDPLSVAADVRRGAVSREAAQSAYGVVLAEDGDPDLEATRARRRRNGIDLAAPGGPLPWTVDPGGRASCRSCDGDVGNMRAGARPDGLVAVQEVASQDLSPHNRDPGLFIDEPVALVIWGCPTCGVAHDSELMIGEIRTQS